MARAGILYSQVARVAEQLAADGKNPTIDTVREALGSTGSKSTIAPMLKRWKAEQQDTVAAAEAGLPASLVQAVKGLHEHMQSEFAQRTEQAQQTHDKALREAAEREEAQRAERQALAEGHAALSEKLEQAQAALVQLQAVHHAQSVRLATIEAESAGLQQRLADRAAEVDTLRHQLSLARTQFEHYQEATAVQRAEERQGYERRIAHLEQDLVGAQRHISEHQTTIAQQEAINAHLAAEQTRREQMLHTAQAELAAACTARDRLAGRLEDETGVKERLATQLNSAHQQLTDVRAELASKAREAEMLAAHLHRAEDRGSQLAEEKSGWMQERGALEQRVQAAERKAANRSNSTPAL